MLVDIIFISGQGLNDSRFYVHEKPGGSNNLQVPPRLTDNFLFTSSFAIWAGKKKNACCVHAKRKELMVAAARLKVRLSVISY